MISIIGGTNVIKMHALGADYEYNDFIDEVFENLPSNRPSIVVDLEGMDYINSMGINFLLRLMKRLSQEGGSLAIASANERVRTVLETTQLYDLFNPYDSVEEAIRG